MELMTISELSGMFRISTRTLRYYEEIGMLSSLRIENYAYRVYDEAAVRRLQQILVLRKLKIPLKRIALVFEDPEQRRLLEVIRQTAEGMDREIASLRTIREILADLLARLEAQNKVNLLEDTQVLELIQTLTLPETKKREEHTMEELNQADKTLSALKNARIIYLPPCTVAASHYIGKSPEDEAGRRLDEFVRGTELHKRKPDLRVYGFNNPSPSDEAAEYGYEFWVTIPEDLEVPPPLEKKRFAGGLYAAHCITMGDFQEWQLLWQWGQQNGRYKIDIREPFGMGGCLEEHLNIYSYYQTARETAKVHQLDLLLPVKETLP